MTTATPRQAQRIARGPADYSVTEAMLDERSYACRVAPQEPYRDKP